MTQYNVDDKGLCIQDLSTLDIAKLTPTSREVIARQATINVGTIGHVAHGKSTVVKALTGLSTIRHKSEKERNITIKLGYANAKMYKTADAECPSEMYCSRGSSEPDEWEGEIRGKKVFPYIHQPTSNLSIDSIKKQPYRTNRIYHCYI